MRSNPGNVLQRGHARCPNNRGVPASENRLKPIALMLAAALGSAAVAQTVTPPKAAPRPAAKAPAKAPAKAVPKAPPEVPPAAADEEQKVAASMALVGDYACEFDQTVSVLPNPKHEAYLDMAHKTQRWLMKPVLSSTGALRLEDVKGRMLMIQIANKSMVMDARIGQRMVDGCMHEKQREFTRMMESQPAPESMLK